MLYKVTPMMPSADDARKAARKAREPGQPRKKRKTAIYDADGHEVLITLMCLKCKSMKPLAQFGLRKMADGAIRNQPWCRTCRGAAGQKKKGDVDAVESAETADATASEPNVEAPAVMAADTGAHPETGESTSQLAPAAAEDSQPSAVAFSDEVTHPAADSVSAPVAPESVAAAEPA